MYIILYEEIPLCNRFYTVVYPYMEYGNFTKRVFEVGATCTYTEHRDSRSHFKKHGRLAGHKHRQASYSYMQVHTCSPQRKPAHILYNNTILTHVWTRVSIQTTCQRTYTSCMQVQPSLSPWAPACLDVKPRDWSLHGDKATFVGAHAIHTHTHTHKRQRFKAFVLFLCL